jgi:hypothetical protein
MSAFPIPPFLREAARNDDHGRLGDWVLRLPQVVEQLSARWSLTLGSPYQHGGSAAWVAPARGASGEELVLKVGWRHEEAMHERIAYAGFGILIALRTRNVQATQSSFLLFFPLLFLTPNFVPFDRLSPLMETLARINPISYVIVGLRSPVIEGWDAGKIGAAVLVIALLGIVLTGLSLRAIATYDR